MNRRHVEIALCVILFVTLILLLLPATQSGRISDSDSWTRNNLKQAALAVHNFHDTYRRLPDAFNVGGSYTKDPKSVWFHLLPYVEADSLYKSGTTAAVVPCYCAPSDPYNMDPAGKVNFAANLRIFAHQTLGKERANAVGVPVIVPPSGTLCSSNLTLPRIFDGTSNVLMLTTRYAECSGESTRYAAGPADFGGFFGAGSHRLPPESGRVDDAMYQVAPKNDAKARDGCNPKPAVYGHSFSKRGLLVALVDGTVRYVGPSLSPTTFMRALCPGDGEKLLDDWLAD